MANARIVSYAELERAAGLLCDAQGVGRPVEPISETLALTVEDAYRIQELNVDRRVRDGAVVVGRKIGLTSSAMQNMLGVHEPDFGTLLDDMALEDGAEVRLEKLLQPRAEAEIAFVLAEDIRGSGWTAATIAPALAGAKAAIEIIDSRITDWRISLVDTVADNASSALFVLGARLTPLRDLDLRFEGMVMTNEGGGVVDTGAGGAALGDPLACVAWLANKLAEFGAGLQAGDVVLSGALHRAVPVEPGDVLQAEFGRLGTVTTRFVSGSR